MVWTSVPVPHTMLQVVTIWALLNLTVIAFLAGLFLVDDARSTRGRRRGRRGGSRVIPISGR